MNSNRLQYLQELLKDSPEDPFIHYGIAMEYVDSNPEKAADILKKLTDTHSEYLPAYYTLGNLYYENENYEEALAVVEKGISLSVQQKEEKTEKELRQLLINIEFEV